MAVICSGDGCVRPAIGRGMCTMHYQRWKRAMILAGTPVQRAVAPPPIDRLMARVVVTPGPLDTDCWICMLATNGVGYSKVYANGRLVYGHRLAYEHFVGPITEGLQLDHLCRVPRCVNPAHLEAVTPQINMNRGMTPAAITKRTNLCKRGHSMDDAYHWRDRRQCRACRAIHNKASEARKKAAA